jgi:Skp family chaperone for outer membrane proteins
MRRLLIACVALVFVFAGCGGGYKQPHQRSPEQLQLADQATAISNQAEALQKLAPDLDSLKKLADTAVAFAVQANRLGVGSLEGRDAFNELRFQANAAAKDVNQNSHPELVSDLEKIQNSIREIGKKLGYKDSQ